MLRYFAIHFPGFDSPSIGNLYNLETLILNPRTGVTHLPDTFWNLLKLSHLYSTCNYQYPGVQLPSVSVGSSCNLLELKTISCLCCHSWDNMEKDLSKFPNVRQIKCQLNVYERAPVNDSKVMDFSFLSYLEALSLLLCYIDTIEFSSEFEFIFPENIKTLSLPGCRLLEIKISRIAELTNLTVLKLLELFFIGDTRHVEEGEFAALKFLKSNMLDLVKWTVSDDQFPNLEKLVLRKCNRLEEIPDQCLQNVAALKMIEVMKSSDCLASVVKEVEDCQKDMGTSGLKVHVHSTRQR